MLKIYGIKNCDTIKKTLKWFDSQQASYEFVDYKKQPPNETLVTQFLNSHDWDTVVNKRGTTWRKLDEQTKASMDAKNALMLMQEQPSIIKRPIIEKDGQFWIGYDEKLFEQLI
ncbi:MAG: arsenate reductase [Reinekea sp.]|jgi:arsenate reductase (glutaredoxin)